MGIEVVKRGSSPDWDTTTVTVRKPYVKYCQQGAAVGGGQFVNFTDTPIFEFCPIGVLTYGEVNLHDPWFEQNTACAVDFRSGSVTNIFGGRFDQFYEQPVFNGAGDIHVNVYGAEFTGSAAFQHLFPAGTAITGSVNITGPKFKGLVPSSWRICGTVGTDLIGGDIVRIDNMDIVVYRFIHTGTTANLSQYPVARDIAGFTSFIAHDAGNIVGLNAYYSQTIAAGDYTADVLINGSGGLMQKEGNTGNLTYNHDYLTARFNKGDEITTQLITSNTGAPALFAPTGGTMIIEVIVAYGKDGKP
jgi:hypothetical protein